MRKGFLLLVVGALLLGACGGQPSSSPVTPVGPGTSVPNVLGGFEMAVVGHSAPDFSLANSELVGVEKLSDLRGQVVLLNFWATWCQYCVREIPALEAVYQQYRDEGFLVIGVDLGETPAEVAEFREAVPFTYPVAYDANERIFRDYGGRGVPVSFLLDREGIIRYIIYGETSEEMFAARVSEVLARP